MFSKPFTKHLPHQIENLAPTAYEASECLCLLVQRPEASMTLGSLFTAYVDHVFLLLIEDKHLSSVCLYFVLESSVFVSIPPQ